MSERRLLSTVAAAIAPLTLRYVLGDNMRCALEIRNGADVLFQINEDDIFDDEGNRFENDLELET